MKNNSVYCSQCNSCGYEGCCSPLNCKFTPEGDYCNTYLKDLKFGYRMYGDLMMLLDRREIVFEDEEYQKILDKNYDIVYGK